MSEATSSAAVTTSSARKRKRAVDASPDDRPRTRKASVQEDTYKKDMYLVFVKNALKEKSQGTPAEFDQLVARFNKVGTKSQSITELKLWISALKHVVSSLERVHAPLVTALINFPWVTTEETFAKSYIDLMSMLISARPEYLGSTLAQIALGFTARYVNDLNSSKAREATSDATVVYERLHALLQRLLSLVPTLSTTLEPFIIRNFPHKRQDRTEQVAYIQNVLKLSVYCVELRDRILGLVVDRAIQIDVEIQVELEDLDEGLLESANLPEADASGSSSDEEDTLSITSDDDDYRKEEKTSLKNVAEMMSKLDAILKLLFEHLSPTGSLTQSPLQQSSSSDSESSSAATTILAKSKSVLPAHEEDLESMQAARRSQFLTLLTIFDRTILRTFKSRYTQFLLFWYSSLDPEYTDLFLGLLVSRALFEQDQPAVTRSAAASYIASLVSRALYVDRDSARRTVGLLCDYLDGQLAYADDLLHEAQQNGGIGPDGLKISVSHFSVFYAVAQAVFLVFCFRWRDFEITTDDDEQVPGRTGKKWIAELDVMQRVVTSALNPLKHCSQNVVKQFARIAQKTGFVYCYGILENNKRAEWAAAVYSTSTPSTPIKFAAAPRTSPITPRNVPLHSIALPSPVRLFVVAESTIENDTNAFFPFDPYKLPGSASFIEDIYREWSMVALDDDDSDEEGDEDGQDVALGDGVDEEDEVQLGHSFNEMSISPRRVSLATA